jgi:hypothetical protein
MVFIFDSTSNLPPTQPQPAPSAGLSGVAADEKGPDQKAADPAATVSEGKPEPKAEIEKEATKPITNDNTGPVRRYWFYIDFLKFEMKFQVINLTYGMSKAPSKLKLLSNFNEKRSVCTCMV